MAKKKRSEIFSEKLNKSTNPSIKRKKKKSKRKKSIFRRLFTLIFCILFFVITYEKFYNTPQRSIYKAIATMKNADSKGEEKYFDRVREINEHLSNSYSGKIGEREEFLKANYSNLKVEIKSIEKKDDYLIVNLSVTNSCFIDVYDKKIKDSKNIHNDFIRALTNENQDKNTMDCTLLLYKKPTYYKIYESKEFINASLGGALKYAE